MKRTALERRTELRTDPATTREFVRRGQRSTASSSKRRPISPASLEQRDAVADRVCVNCGSGDRCDPAHLVSRAQGGCDDALCVIALCRVCHSGFDGGLLDLSPVLALPEFAAERSHMALHLSLPQCLQRLSGRRWRATEEESV